jgi:TolB-like protein/Flp pilus assembly protein TadD
MAVAFILGLAVMASTGMLVWQRSHRSTDALTGGVERLAVLPFENLGSSGDAYFADGITDEVRGKLAALPGLQVTASNSSSQYKGTTAKPQQIGQELGVKYLLVGKVRWEKGPAGQSRVRVSPELVEVATASTKWQQPFEAALTDVFKVQGDIARQVADALNLALGAPERQALGARPTTSLDAYDAFLKGEAANEHMSTLDARKLRTAVGFYERAIALDSGFGQAWAQLSRTYTVLYGAVKPDPIDGAAAKRGAERAAALAPGLAETQLALGDYYQSRVDPGRALVAYETGLRAFPNNAELLAGAAIVQGVLGNADRAARDLERAAILDPRTAWIAFNLTSALMHLRRYAEAEAACNRGLAANPGHIGLKEYAVMVRVAQGDLPGAQAVLRDVSAGVDRELLVAYFATYMDFYWVLDTTQQRALLQLGPRHFGDDRGTWGLAMAQLYALRGEQAKSRSYADSARIAYEANLRGSPQDPQQHALLGLALAHLGRKADAVREGERSLELMPSERSGLHSYARHLLARSHVLSGEPEKALDQLELLLKVPYFVSPGWLRVDPNFAPLRGNPRFERLTNGT